jgi:ABC-type transport system involved in Fe-S cluster assembly fused permease/ATPase subunit
MVLSTIWYVEFRSLVITTFLKSIPTEQGYIYRSINQSLVDTERLLKLLDESTDVNDKPGAPDLVVTDGEIEFRELE